VKKISSRGNSGEKEEFALASGEEANIREKAREVYCPRTTSYRGMAQWFGAHYDQEARFSNY